MDLTLRRASYEKTGIYGQYFDTANNRIAFTLEHAFENSDGSYSPALPPGVYTCVRGIHHLARIPNIETFEVMNVPGHTGILAAHPGNYNNDSDGCILVGLDLGSDMIVKSVLAFANFMAIQDGLNQFKLSVS